MTTIQNRINVSALTHAGSIHPVSLQPAPFSQSSLAAAVEAAVKAVHESSLTPVFQPCSGPAYVPRTLLALLCFSYARGIYASRDIESALQNDFHFKQVCHGVVPAAWVLRHFRRNNRKPLRSCLQAALCFLAQQKVAQGFVTRVNKTHLQQEAVRRITFAAFLDREDVTIN